VLRGLAAIRAKQLDAGPPKVMIAKNQLDKQSDQALTPNEMERMIASATSASSSSARSGYTPVKERKSKKGGNAKRRERTTGPYVSDWRMLVCDEARPSMLNVCEMRERLRGMCEQSNRWVMKCVCVCVCVCCVLCVCCVCVCVCVVCVCVPSLVFCVVWGGWEACVCLFCSRTKCKPHHAHAKRTKQTA
jgi:Flp pilus assembly protein TadB